MLLITVQNINTNLIKNDEFIQLSMVTLFAEFSHLLSVCRVSWHKSGLGHAWLLSGFLISIITYLLC